MHADIHFVKGHSHDICEDYGIVDEHGRFMIIADGCSTGKHSDVAARVMVHTCKRSLSYFLDRGSIPGYSVLGDHMLSAAITASQTMGLDALLSTVLVAFQSPTGILVYVYGDGFVVSKPKGVSDLEIVKIDFINNTPNYLWYRTNEKRYAAPGCDLKVNNEVFPRDHDLMFHFDPNTIDFLGLFTDGVCSFILNRPENNTSFPEKMVDNIAIGNLLDFKSFGGAFVKRRMNRFVKLVTANGFIFDDDITCAVMKIGENE